MLQIQRDDQRTSGVGSRENSDHARRLHNLIRYGVVAEVDYTGATATYPAIRVSLQDGELTSDWIPWATLRAGNDRVWDPPEVGEVVLLLSSSGDLANALALPAVFSAGNQNGDRAGLHRRTYQDGTVVEYDRQSHTLTVDTTDTTGHVVIRTGTASIEASGTVSVQAGGAVTVQAGGQVSISGSTVRLNPLTT